MCSRIFKKLVKGNSHGSAVLPLAINKASDNRLYAEISISGTCVSALLDSGAQTSLVDVSLLSRLGISFCRNIRPSVVSADNSPITILGGVDIPISFNGFSYAHPCLVSDGLPTQFILGIEFWNKYGLTSILCEAFSGLTTGKLLVPSSRIINNESLEVSETRYIHPRAVLSADQELQLQAAIDGFAEISSDKVGLGCTNLLSHKIETT